MGLGEGLQDVFGGKNDAKSEVGGPSNALYQLPNQQQNRNALQQYQQTAGNMQAQQLGAPNLQTAQADAARQQQQNLNNTLTQAANGQGLSAAQGLLQRNQEDQIAAAQSAAASAGGDTNPFLAQRAANEQAQRAMATGGAQMAIQRANEVQTAQGLLGQQLSGMRGQDMNQANSQVQFAQQAAMANQSAALQQNAQNQQAQQYALSNTMGLDTQQLQANMAMSQAQMQTDQYNNSMNMGVAAQNAQAAGAYGQAAFQGAMQAGATAAMMSDERLKENVDRDGTDSEIDGFLDALDPASYTYINPKHGEGRHWSVMAQSAAKTPVGRSFVVETPDGLGLDTRKASAVALTALATLHKRIGKLERKS